MSDPRPGKRYGTIRAWPDLTAATPTWRYLCEEPAPQLTPAGTPQVTLINAGDLLMVTVGASLGVGESALAAARAAIAAEAGIEVGSVTLRPADLTVRSAVLEFVPPEGETRELARVSPSPTAPHSAAFSAMLQGADAKAARAALDEGRGHLRVRYAVDLTASRSATAEVAGDWDDDADFDALLSDGRLTVSVDADDGASEELVERAQAEALRDAAASIARLATGAAAAKQPDPQAVQHQGVAAKVTKSETIGQQMELTADVENWI